MIQDKNIYILVDKKKIIKNGKIRNIYVKKNNFQEKYIKSKGKFIRFFDKKDYYIITIKNIDKYKNNLNIFANKKIVNIIKKKFEKNPNGSYIFPKNKSFKDSLFTGGVGYFSDDVIRNDDKVLHRGLLNPVTLGQLNNQPEELDYNKSYDNIISEISNIAYSTKIFEIINNLMYEFSNVDDVNNYIYEIRPYIEFNKNNNNKFIIFFYINTLLFDDGDFKRYIKLPFHVSLFVKDMLKKRNNSNLALNTVIECLTTGHIHLTSDENKQKFNIYTKLKDFNYVINKPKPTHTYISASSISDFAEIMINHGKKIFDDWYYSSNADNNQTFNLYYPDYSSNNCWELYSDTSRRPLLLQLTNDQKYSIFLCFKNLYKIIYNIFKILDKKVNDITNIKRYLFDNEIDVILLKNSHYNYLVYNIPTKYTTSNPMPNIQYLDNLGAVKREYAIFKNNVIEAGIKGNKCPGELYRQRRTPSPRGRRTPSPRGRRTPSPRGRRTPSPRGRRTPSPRGRRTPSPRGRRYGSS